MENKFRKQKVPSFMSRYMNSYKIDDVGKQKRERRVEEN